MIRNEKCEVMDKQNFEPKYRMVYDICQYKHKKVWPIKTSKKLKNGISMLQYKQVKIKKVKNKNLIL